MVSETDTLNASIYKDAKLLYENQIFNTKRQNQIPGFHTLRIYVYVNSKPPVKKIESCKLVCKDGQNFDLNVLGITTISTDMYIITFCLELKFQTIAAVIR